MSSGFVGSLPYSMMTLAIRSASSRSTRGMSVWLILLLLALIVASALASFGMPRSYTGSIENATSRMYGTNGTNRKMSSLPRTRIHQGAQTIDKAASPCAEPERQGCYCMLPAMIVSNARSMQPRSALQTSSTPTAASRCKQHFLWKNTLTGLGSGAPAKCGLADAGTALRCTGPRPRRECDGGPRSVRGPGRHPALAHAALVHAQFETIHPFPDGNGRAIIHVLLRRRGITRNVTVPISAGHFLDVEAYLDALGEYRRGNVKPIIEEMSDAASLRSTTQPDCCQSSTSSPPSGGSV